MMSSGRMGVNLRTFVHKSHKDNNACKVLPPLMHYGACPVCLSSIGMFTCIVPRVKDSKVIEASCVNQVCGSSLTHDHILILVSRT